MPEFMYYSSGTRDLNPRSQGRKLSGPTRPHILDQCTAIYDRIRCGWLTSRLCLPRNCTFDHGTVLSYIVPPPLCFGMHLGSWPAFRDTRLFTSVSLILAVSAVAGASGPVFTVQFQVVAVLHRISGGLDSIYGTKAEKSRSSASFFDMICEEEAFTFMPS